jgi:tRNA U34 5-carboxymethylaminomethyl modifying GTPase MnmE/TrmE
MATADGITVERLTAPAPGAIAVLRLSGPEPALSALLAARLRKPGTGAPFRTLPAIDRPRHAQWLGAAGEVIDDLVCIRTGPGEAELHCHGGTGVVTALTASIPTGPAPAPTLEAVYLDALARARTPRIANLLLHQLAAIPAWLAARPLNWSALDAGRRWGELLESPPPLVVLVGAANAGKSTLFNALLGRDRVLVSPQPGTTRDVVIAETAVVRGLPIRLADTAGIALRPDGRGVALSADRLERRGQLRTLRVVRDADLLIAVVPVGASRPSLTDPVAAGLPPIVGVRSQIDRAAASDPPPTAGEIAVSAPRDIGLDSLVAAIGDALRIPGDDTIVPLVPLGPLRARHAADVERKQAAADGTTIRPPAVDPIWRRSDP